MERRPGLIGPSCNAHGQAFWGFGGNAPEKIFWAHFVYIETNFGD